MTDKRPLAFACLVLAGLAIGSVSGVAQPQPVPAAPHACLEEERQAIENGEGFGMALAADRHGYPGPKHILELKNELALTPEQEKQVRALFDQMRGRALMTGQRVLDKEAELEQLFVSSAPATTSSATPRRSTPGSAGRPHRPACYARWRWPRPSIFLRPQRRSRPRAPASRSAFGLKHAARRRVSRSHPAETRSGGKSCAGSGSTGTRKPPAATRRFGSSHSA